MTQELKVCRISLALTVLLTASYGNAEEPRGGRVRVESSREAREALAASIPRREYELALRDQKEVLAEVKKQIQELGLTASADELTDLLWQRAQLEIALDKCQLGRGDCHAVAAEMAAVEASFRKKTGLSMREFRSGRRDTPERDARRASGIGQITAQAASDTCTCAFTVYSLDRWMSPHWGLECNNHASHGVCSNNVDSAHSAGTGAMTGDVDLYFGGNHANLDCPDDHYTCFRGPGTGSSTDDQGAWGNACSCDTWHSQYYNPLSAWYGGALTDSLQVEQLSTGWMTVGGACNEVSVSVKEFIKENDPWCCDDSMGDLWVSLPLADGYGTTSGAASAQNCNGGSQSGVYPYCATFGATIKVAYNCYTYSPPPPPICDPDGSMEQACYGQGGPYQWDSNSCTCRCIGSYSICPPE
jgi:hypothetical protein